MICLGDWLAWTAAAVNGGIALWQISGWQRLARAEKQQAQLWIDREVEQFLEWARSRQELEDEGGI
jgi:hypothetical protein